MSREDEDAEYVVGLRDGRDERREEIKELKVLYAEAIATLHEAQIKLCLFQNRYGNEHVGGAEMSSLTKRIYKVMQSQVKTS